MPIRSAYGYKRAPQSLAGLLSKFGSSLPGNAVRFPDVVNLHQPKWISEPYDQGNEGSCVFNGYVGLREYSFKRSGGPLWTPSRQFGYYVTRDYEGTLSEDSGAFVHDTFHTGAYVGIVPEGMWPYSNSMFLKPSADCYEEAKKWKNPIFAAVDTTDLNAMLSCLSHGFPFEMGFQVPSIFESESFSQNPYLTPDLMRYRIVGGHGVAVFGYEIPKRRFLVRNSWGVDWGNDGLFYIDFDFMTNPRWVNDGMMIRENNQERTLQ